LVPPDHLWIAVTLFAALAQTIRNAAQRHLTPSLGTLGATLVRFLYGLPFALLWMLFVQWFWEFGIPAPNPGFLAWIVFGAVAQIAATALLLRVMAERNFALGIGYSKSEVMQVAIFGLVFLGDPLTPLMVVAILLGTVGVLLIAPIDPRQPLRALFAGWTSRVALLGLGSGALFGLAAVGYRGGALALTDTPFPMAAAFGLVVAQTVQTLLLGGWLLAREPAVVVRVIRAWRTSMLAGFMGAAASAGWFTAMAIESVARVRTLALAELLFAWVVSRRVFKERLTRLELIGMIVLGIGIAVVTLGE
jgi:drug/metabolite transporter (DMT)-like permease